MSTVQSKSIARRHIEDAYGKRDIRVLDEVMAKDVCDHSAAPGQPKGLEGQRWFFETFYKAFPDTTCRLVRLVGEGDLVVDHWTASGTHTGEFLGMPPTGKRFTLTGSDMTRIENGKIAEIWHYEDMLSLLQQLGAIPMAAQGGPMGETGPAMGQMSAAGRGRIMSDDEKRALIRRGFEVFIDRNDTAAADMLVAPDFVGHFSAAPEVNGREAFKQFVAMYNGGFSNHHAKVEDILIDGEYGACLVTYTGKHTGDLMGTPASGKDTTIKGLSIFRFAGDQVAEYWANNDDLGLLQQVARSRWRQGWRWRSRAEVGVAGFGNEAGPGGRTCFLRAGRLSWGKPSSMQPPSRSALRAHWAVGSDILGRA